MWTDVEHQRRMHLPVFGPERLTDQEQELAEALRREIEGEVRFDAGSKALYAVDASNYRQVPIGVVIPKSAADIMATLEVCRRFHAPVLARGAGTSLAGQCCNVAVVLDTTKYLHHIYDLDEDRRLISTQPGVTLDTLRHHVQRRSNLTFGPDPSTHKYCSIGGMLGNDACGVHAQVAGRMVYNVESLEVLTYDGLRLRVGKTSPEELSRFIQEGGRRGEIYWKLKSFIDRYEQLIRARYPQIPRRVSGYNNLDQLFDENGFNVAGALVGTEGTCVTILEATLKLIHFGRYSSLVVLGYKDVFSLGDHIPLINSFNPIGVEGIDHRLKEDIEKTHLHERYIDYLPEGNAWLMVQFWGDSQDEADTQAHRFMDTLLREKHAPTVKLLDDPEQMDHLWKVRESGLGATARIPGKPDAWPGWEDSAVPPEQIGPYLRALNELFKKYGFKPSLYGHFGQGCVHCRVPFDLGSKKGIRHYRSFMDEATDLVLRFGGSFSGEHGDGQARAEYLPKMYGPELVQGFREFKAIWDPENRMNPGKLVDPLRNDQDLRFGPDFHPRRVKTFFKYPNDDGQFLRATQRCVGVGKCREKSGATMCPSYMVTLEERHTTRGRAHSLFEMLQGDVLKGGWKDEEVHQALDLCLACKGCKGDCPMHVDMATYKAEFLAHYYKRRLRPRSAYAFGLIYWWARLASKVPRLVNLATHAPGLRGLAKFLAGMPQERTIPPFATQTFREWFAQHEPRHFDGPRVLLWPDTFNNFFHPEVAQAAVEVLETAGFRVEIPRKPLCCGRPLYDYGMLPTAKHLLRQILRTLKEDIASGTPIVGLEPSCVSVFRDELTNLYPEDERAKALSKQTFMLGEFLEQKAKEWQPPKLKSRAVVHGHCHHKSVLKMSGEKSLLDKVGLQYQLLESGCCGMAGSFGFEKEHYDVSIKVGDRVLLPAVRQADPETLIVADGFSCQEQIQQQTDRRALHVAQVLQAALHERDGSLGAYPERKYTVDRVKQARDSVKFAAVALGVLAVTAGLLWRAGTSA